MDGWNTSFLLGRSIFRGHVGAREGKGFTLKDGGCDVCFKMPRWLPFLSMIHGKWKVAVRFKGTHILEGTCIYFKKCERKRGTYGLLAFRHAGQAGAM